MSALAPWLGSGSQKQVGRWSLAWSCERTHIAMLPTQSVLLELCSIPEAALSGKLAANSRLLG